MSSHAADVKALEVEELRSVVGNSLLDMDSESEGYLREREMQEKGAGGMRVGSAGRNALSRVPLMATVVLGLES